MRYSADMELPDIEVLIVVDTSKFTAQSERSAPVSEFDRSLGSLREAVAATSDDVERFRLKANGLGR